MKTVDPHYYHLGDGTDIIHLIGLMYGTTQQIGFIQGNILKYLMRWERKNGIEDLRKAEEYLERLIIIARNIEKIREEYGDEEAIQMVEDDEII